LSTLTKVLIVLLTISAIFLCGIVVTYVSNAQNYKQKHDSLRNQYQAAVRNKENADKQLNKAMAEANEKEQKLKQSESDLRIQIQQLETQLADARNTAARAVAQENNWKELSEKFLTANETLQKTLQDRLDELTKVKAKNIQGDKELNQTTDALIEKMAIIDSLEKSLRQLMEEKTELLNRMGQQLQLSGQAVPAPVAVTSPSDKARVATGAVDIGLNGLVTMVDMDHSLAEISIGSASGVKENMRFHVTRADKFICSLLILDVEPEKAVGELRLLGSTKEKPQAGDNVSTNL
jgi:hypothetical protein